MDNSWQIQQKTKNDIDNQILASSFLRKTASGANRIAIEMSTILLSMFLSSIDLGLIATSK
jgi:hypothetical protein